MSPLWHPVSQLLSRRSKGISPPLVNVHSWNDILGCTTCIRGQRRMHNLLCNGRVGGRCLLPYGALATTRHPCPCNHAAFLKVTNAMCDAAALGGGAWGGVIAWPESWPISCHFDPIRIEYTQCQCPLHMFIPPPLAPSHPCNPWGCLARRGGVGLAGSMWERGAIPLWCTIPVQGKGLVCLGHQHVSQPPT